LLFKEKIYKYFISSMYLIIVTLLFSCQFNPVYVSNDSNLLLCSIKVADEKNSAPLYELDFKNELKYILCSKKVGQVSYLLEWNITKSYRELIKSATNTTKRYEETLIINFTIYDVAKDTIVFSDYVSSIGAYNILEDEIISTLSSKNSIESLIAIKGARLTLDKILLFMLKNEDSKL